MAEDEATELLLGHDFWSNSENVGFAEEASPPESRGQTLAIEPRESKI